MMVEDNNAFKEKLFAYFMSLVRREYYAKEDMDGLVSGWVFVDRERLGAIITRFMETYSDNKVCGDRSAYLVKGNFVDVSLHHMLINSETIDGLERLADELGLPRPS